MVQLQLISDHTLGWLVVTMYNLFGYCTHLDLKSLASAPIDTDIWYL